MMKFKVSAERKKEILYAVKKLYDAIEIFDDDIDGSDFSDELKNKICEFANQFGIKNEEI